MHPLPAPPYRPGPYAELLGALARHPAMLRVGRLGAPHPRMRDREHVLRFLALLRSGPRGFASPVKAWLNAEMRAHRELGAAQAGAMADAFETAVGLAEALFGDAACRPPLKSAPSAAAAAAAAAAADGGADGGGADGGGGGGGSGGGLSGAGEINVALWDTLLYSLATAADPAAVLARRGEVAAAWAGLCRDERFRKLLVSTPKAVLARASAWDRVFAAVLGRPHGVGPAGMDGLGAQWAALG